MKKIEEGNVNIALIITRGDSIGGAQIHVKDLAYALQALGNKVTILLGKEGNFTELLTQEGISYRLVDDLVREINPKKDLRALSHIKTLLKDINPDIVAVHSSKAGILGRLATRQLKIPTTFTVHGWAFTEGVSAKKKIVYKMIEKVGALFTTKLIAVSKFDRQLALDNNICPSDKIVAVQNGVPDVEAALLATPEKPIPKMIMIARFQEQKNHKALIEALNELKDLDWELELVGGDGGKQAGVEELIQQYGLGDKINILGHKNNIKELISKSQIFVLSTNWEGFPLTTLEAMRAKLPVVATNVGGVSEAIDQGKTGFAINSQDELLEALRKLITDAELRKTMGEEARRQYLEFFTVDAMLKNTYAVYNGILETQN